MGTNNVKTKLEGYETVKERKQKWYKKYPDGSLVTVLVFHEKGHCIVMGMAYRSKEEQKDNLPTGIGYAEEYQGQGGFANKTSWMENCDESAIGRALDNAGYSGNNKCSREEMEKVERHDKEEKKEEPKKSKEDAQANARAFFKTFLENPKLTDDVKKYFENLKEGERFKISADNRWEIASIDAEITSFLLQETA
ncbi:MAG: hypothetical protein GY861_11785 [bacterium]|nr:hypothetical protein [bacterium]